MAYESTGVAVWTSQGEIMKLVMAHGGTAVGFDAEGLVEGFHAKIKIGGVDYVIHITAHCQPAPMKRKDGRSSYLSPTTEDWRAKFAEQERRRVWRVLFYYLKNAFECAAAGVVELREILLPHIVMGDGLTIGQHILPRLEQAVQDNPARLLGA